MEWEAWLCGEKVLAVWSGICDYVEEEMEL